MEHTGFPSDETLAAFIDGKLDAETRRRVVEHMADCSECYETYLGATAWGREGGRLSGGHGAKTRSWRIPFAIAATVALLALLGMYSGALRQFFPAPVQTATTISAAANGARYRTIDARISGAFLYKQLAPNRRSVEDERHNADLLDLRIAANEAERRVHADPSRANLLDYGTASLLLGDYDESQRVLEDALRRETHIYDLPAGITKCVDIELLNALTALYTARAELRHNLAPLAVETASRAWSLKQTPETAWNRAVAFEAIHDTSDAEKAWVEYLTLDPHSQWSGEAMRRSQSRKRSQRAWPPEKQRLIEAVSRGDRGLRDGIVRTFRQEARTFAEDELLTDWARGVTSTDGNAGETLPRLVALGSALKETNNDSIVADAAQRIIASDHREKLAIAEGLKDFAQARAMHSAQDSSRAATALQKVAETFRRLRFPLWCRAEVFRATAMFYVGRSDEALSILRILDDELSEESRRERYPSIDAQLFWTRGIIHFAGGKPFEALQDYERAATLFERLGEAENQAFMHTLLGQIHGFIGQHEAEWREYLAAASIVDHNQSMRRAPLMMGHLARTALAEGCVAASTAFQRLAETSGGSVAGDASFRVDAFLAQARLNARCGDMVKARAAMASAQASGGSIVDSVVRARIVDDIQAAGAEAGILDKQEGVVVLSRAIATAEDRKDVFRLSRFYFARASLHVDLAEPEAALRDYDAGISTLQTHSADLRARSDVREWLQASRRWYDRAIEFAMASGRPEQAVAWAETARRQFTASTVAESKTVAAEVARKLPSKDLTLAYWSTETQLFIWSISRLGLQTHVLAIGRDELQELTSRTLSLLEEGRDAEARDALANTEQIFFAPVRESLSHAERVMIATDEMLGGVPYPALIDRSTGKYAIEQFEIVLVPSVRRGGDVAMSAARAPLTAPLVIADPAFDTHLLPSLKRLRQAAAEAEVIQNRFASTEIAFGDNATIRRLASLIERAGVVHFAAHSLTNREHPGLSALVLAPDASTHDSGLLYARDIERMNLHHVQLVVLAACVSMSGEGGDGFAAIAHSFANAGARQIIGSVWNVRDDQSAEFMAVLYDALSRDSNCSAALRSAQLKMIRDSKTLSWAAFELMNET